MRAEIIATGTELLLGEITDTNTPYIAGRLAMLGIDLFYASTVGDNYERLLGALKQGWNRSDMVILTGGLGPTQGDITREVIAGLLGEKPQVDEGLKKTIEQYFARLGIDMPSNNLKQAVLIPSATALLNPFGTAPGWWVEKQGKIIITLPGPPGEMQPMWQNQVQPMLEKRAGAIILSRTLKIWGLSEAKVDQMASPFLSCANPTLAMYAKQDGIHLRVTAKAMNGESAANMISVREASLKEIFKAHLWGADNDTLEGAVGQLLKSKGLSIAVAETFTGGFLSYTIASAPDSSEYFKGGVVAGGKQSRAIMGLKSLPGTASAEAASAMAAYARSMFSADIGIGVDGSPKEGTGVTPGTVFIAIDTGKVNAHAVQSYSTRPHHMVRRATHQALFLLRKALLVIKP